MIKGNTTKTNIIIFKIFDFVANNIFSKTFLSRDKNQECKNSKKMKIVHITSFVIIQ